MMGLKYVVSTTTRGGRSGAVGTSGTQYNRRVPDDHEVRPTTPVTGAETVGVTALSLAASAIIAAYLLDRVGVAFTPFVVLPVALIPPAILFIWLRSRADWRRRDELLGFAGIVLTSWAWLVWRSRPWFLPLGGGPDITHHLLLIDYIERHWHLGTRSDRRALPRRDDSLHPRCTHPDGTGRRLAALGWTARAALRRVGLSRAQTRVRLSHNAPRDPRGLAARAARNRQRGVGHGATRLRAGLVHARLVSGAGCIGRLCRRHVVGPCHLERCAVGRRLHGLCACWNGCVPDVAGMDWPSGASRSG